MIKPFCFKQFAVYHQYSFKIGTDALLLGALAPVAATTKRALDIGTGSGILALMLAQRGVLSVTGIEINADAATEAQKNIEKSPWAGIKIFCGDFCDQNFTATLDFFDLIVSNPPYFSNALRPPNAQRCTARHNDDSLPFDILIRNAAQLLTPDGLFCVILPEPEQAHFLQIAQKYPLFPTKIYCVLSKPKKPTIRQVLILQKKLPEQIETITFHIQNSDHSYSETYKELTKEFYLGNL